jgi:hypothetical protein
VIPLAILTKLIPHSILKVREFVEGGKAGVLGRSLLGV